MSLTFAHAKALKPGDILIDNLGKRWKVSGQVKLWATMPSRIRIPLKHGMYTYDALTEANFHQDECGLVTREQDVAATRMDGGSGITHRAAMKPSTKMRNTLP